MPFPSGSKCQSMFLPNIVPEPFFAPGLKSGAFPRYTPMVSGSVPNRPMVNKRWTRKSGPSWVSATVF